VAGGQYRLRGPPRRTWSRSGTDTVSSTVASSVPATHVRRIVAKRTLQNGQRFSTAAHSDMQPKQNLATYM